MVIFFLVVLQILRVLQFLLGLTTANTVCTGVSTGCPGSITCGAPSSGHVECVTGGGGSGNGGLPSAILVYYYDY